MGRAYFLGAGKLKVRGVLELTSTPIGDTGAGPVGDALTAKTSVHS